jgi:hypothetical protein
MKTAFFCCQDSDSSGVDIEFTRSTARLHIGGWYDTMVGLQPEEVSLVEFFRRCSITEADLLRAIKEMQQ